jgi:hypothetical protein
LKEGNSSQDHEGNATIIQMENGTSQNDTKKYSSKDSKDLALDDDLMDEDNLLGEELEDVHGDSM